MFKNRFINMGMSFTWFDGVFIILENFTINILSSPRELNEIELI